MFAHFVTSLGGLLIIAAQIWVALAAFQRGILWGLAVLCFTPVAIVFIILNWSKTKQAVILYIVGALMVGWGNHRNHYFEQLQQGRFPTSEA
jgi:hypothetical protein